jgi:hypothetical protein
LRPDHFTFVALHDFQDHDYARHCLPPAEVTRIYNHTTIVNNYFVNNNTVVNPGIRVDRVAAATHREIRPFTIRDVPNSSPAVSRGGMSRTELTVYRPQIASHARPVNMVAQKIDQRHPIIQHASLALQSSSAVARPTSLPANHTYAARLDHVGKQPSASGQPIRSIASTRALNPTWTQQHAGQITVKESANSNSALVVGSHTAPMAPKAPSAEPFSPSTPELNQSAHSLGPASPTLLRPQYSPFSAVPYSRESSGQNPPVYSSKTTYAATETRIGQQMPQSTRTASVPPPARQSQVQWPPASAHESIEAHPHPYSRPDSLARSAPRPTSPGISSAARNQSRPAAPESLRANSAPTVAKQVPPRTQLYVQHSTPPTWTSRPSAPTQASPRAHAEYPAAHPQLSTNPRGADSSRHMKYAPAG